MQDNWQEFDRQIQSVLQDAREKAPRRVWRAVSARLDSAAVWWRWAVPALAIAALVAGLFLTGTFDRNVTKGPSNIDILADGGNSALEDVPATALAELPDGDIAPEATAAVPGAGKAVRRAASGFASKDSGDASGEESAGVQAQTESVSDTAQAPAREAAPADGGKAEDNADIIEGWDRISQEERSSSRLSVRLSGLYAQGSVGGNDSNISYGGSGISHMAPGSGSANAGISENGASTYGIPFTLGLGVRFSLTDKLWLGTGLDYSLLTRSFNGSYSGSLAADYNGSIFHTLHYIGVPLNVYYKLLGTPEGLASIYAWGGGEAELCVSNRYRLMNTGAVVPDAAGGFQFSAALGLGIEFRLSEHLGLYADPAVRYYFHGNQPKSVRTDKPFMFNFDAGLRFNF